MKTLSNSDWAFRKKIKYGFLWHIVPIAQRLSFPGLYWFWNQANYFRVKGYKDVLTLKSD
jgi:hypothetical protein